MYSNKTVLELMFEDEVFMDINPAEANAPLSQQEIVIVYKHSLRNLNRIKKSLVPLYVPPTISKAA